MYAKYARTSTVLKKKIYRLYYNYRGILDINNIYYFICFFLRTTIYVIKDFFGWNMETVDVNVEQGKLRGQKVKSIFGKTYYSFRGVPYAKAPIGPLRFKDPEPAESWTGVRKALRHGKMSAQWDWITSFYVGSEDSLHLNVYTPQMPDNDDSFEKKPVLFWIHGGAFFFGFSNDFVYGPDLFMNENVLLVTINYRLGPLGFFTTGTKDAPGNAGFKDAIMALKWVQKNIVNFGGDADNVTVFGESSGGCMAHAFMMSPLAKGLFHKVIAQSGTAASTWCFSDNLIDCSFKIGKNLGINTNDPKVLVESLQRCSPKKVTLQQKHIRLEKRKRQCIPFEYSLCAEPEDYPNAALTRDVRQLILEGKYISDVPLMIGVNQFEAVSTYHVMNLYYPAIKEQQRDPERVVPLAYKLTPGSEKSKKIAQDIKEFYLEGKPFHRSNPEKFINILTDIHFLEPMITTVTSHLKYLKSPVYSYMFMYEGYRNLYKRMLPFKSIKGPSHCDDIFYLFHLPGMGKNLNSDLPEAEVAKRMARLWANFAKYGNPTPDSNDKLLQNTVWPPVKDQLSPHIVIARDLSISHQHIWNHRINFLNHIAHKYAV